MSIVLDPNNYYRPFDDETILDSLGPLPDWISEQDARSARAQFEAHYNFGVYAIEGASVNAKGVMYYPDDPPFQPLAKLQLRDETIWFYRHAMVAIVQKDGSVFLTRMD